MSQSNSCLPKPSGKTLSLSLALSLSLVSESRCFCSIFPATPLFSTACSQVFALSIAMAFKVFPLVMVLALVSQCLAQDQFLYIKSEDPVLSGSKDKLTPGDQYLYWKYTIANESNFYVDGDVWIGFCPDWNENSVSHFYNVSITSLRFWVPSISYSL